MSKTNKKKYPNRHASKLHNRYKAEYTVQEMYDEWVADEDESIVMDWDIQHPDILDAFDRAVSMEILEEIIDED